MFTKKDRIIANQQAKIKNRDILIGDQQEKINQLRSLLKDIEVIASCNCYGTDGIMYLRKIKELSTTFDCVR